MFAAGALALILAVCDDLVRGRTMQVGGTAPAADIDRHPWPVRSQKGSVP